MAKNHRIVVPRPSILESCRVYLGRNAMEHDYETSYESNDTILDKEWPVDVLIDEYKRASEFFDKSSQYNKMRLLKKQTSLKKTYSKLQQEIRDGRMRLQMLMHIENADKICNYFRNHIDLLRLYKNLPVDQINEKIDQRTFMLRKTRDRLQYRLDTIKREFFLKLEERETIKHRINYPQKIAEERQMNVIERKTQDSIIRLKAFQQIQQTYTLIIRILRYHEMFHEPILKSLEKDISNQDDFINHVTYLLQPFIQQLQKRNKKMKAQTRKSRTFMKELQMRMQLNAGAKELKMRKITENTRNLRKKPVVEHWIDRHVRGTVSMMQLARKLKKYEMNILLVQLAAKCLQPQQICSTFKYLVQMNAQLRKNNALGLKKLHLKYYQERNASIKKQDIQCNYSWLNEMYAKQVKHLEKKIAKEYKNEQALKGHIQESSKALQIFKFAIWNMYETLRHVQVPKDAKVLHRNYPTRYLALPLHTYQMKGHAVPPIILNEDALVVLDVVTKKVQFLMNIFHMFNPEDPLEMWERYHEEYMEYLDDEPLLRLYRNASTNVLRESDDKTLLRTRKLIKRKSAKLVEEKTRLDT